jgi:hypothetical protein
MTIFRLSRALSGIRCNRRTMGKRTTPPLALDQIEHGEEGEADRDVGRTDQDREDQVRDFVFGRRYLCFGVNGHLYLPIDLIATDWEAGHAPSHDLDQSQIAHGPGSRLHLSWH